MSARRARLLLAPIAMLLAPSAIHAQGENLAQLSLRQAVARALERNPLVVESTLEWRRVQGLADNVVGVLAENPLISAEAGLHRDVGYTGNETSLSLRVEQPLDLLGQAHTRREAARGQVAWSQARLTLVRAEIAARTHAAYVGAQVARARVVLGEERLATARQTAAALQMRVRLGASSDIDLGMAEAEVGRAEAAVQDARAQVARARLALRDLLDLPARDAAMPGDAFLPPPASLPATTNQEGLFAHHLAVQVIDKRRLAVDAEIARLERERLPRIAIAFSADRPSNYETLYGVGLSFAPALWRRNQAPLAEARVERERAEVERTITLAALERQFSALVEQQALRMQELAAVEATLRNEETVRTLVRKGWESGKFDFLRVLLAERSVADTKQTRLDMWADLWSNVIEMNRLLGTTP